MYKILIVDDEKWIRKGLIAKLKFLGFDFLWVGEASNGEEADEIIQREQPHIVITDVRMPFMDGIQLIRKTRQSDTRIRFIIISGYTEFEYAEQALNMGVSGYLLKPIADNSLMETLRKVMKELGYEYEMRSAIEKRETLEKDNQVLVLERTINQAFHTPGEIAKDLLEGGIHLPWLEKSCCYILILIHIDSSNYYQSDFKYQDLDLIKFAIKNIVEEMGAGNKITVINNYKDITQLFVLYPSFCQESIKRHCDRFVFDMYAKIKKYLKISVTIAVSDSGEEISGELHRQAKLAFDMRLVNGGDQIYKYDNLRMNQKINIPEHRLKLLQKCMELYDFQNIQVILRDLFQEHKSSGASGVYARLLYLETVRIIIKICNNFDIDIETSFDPEFISGEVLDHFDSTDQIVSYLYTTIMDILHGEPAVGSDCRELVNKAKRYIENNFCEEITVKELANSYAINPNYFSTIFKRETGSTVMKFLTDVRMEKACRLLKETQAGVNEVAQIVGYQDTQYFYRVFKKATGKTPLEYRSLE